MTDPPAIQLTCECGYVAPADALALAAAQLDDHALRFHGTDRGDVLRDVDRAATEVIDG